MTARVFLAGLVVAGAVRAAPDYKALAAQLKDPKRRVAAYRQLRAAKDPSAVGAVRRVIEDLPDSQRHWGLSVLEAYPPAVARRAFRPLTRSASPWTRLFAAEYLHRHDVQGMDRIIHGALKTPEMHPDVKRRMLSRLFWGRLPRYKPLRRTVRGFLAEAEPAGVIADATLVLKGADDDGSAESARALLEDARPAVRAYAAALLLHLGFSEHVGVVAEALRTGKLHRELYRVELLLRGSDGIPIEVKKAVRELLERDLPAPMLRSLVGWVKRIKDRDAMPQLRKLLEHKDAGVKKEAGEVLLKFAGRGSAGASNVPKSLDAADAAELAEMLRKKDREAVRKWLMDKRIARRLLAADALRRMDDESGLPVILAVLADAKSQERPTAAKLLAGFRCAEVVPPLLAALDDKDIAVRSSAFRSLGTVWTALFPHRVIRMASVNYDPMLDRAKNAPAVAALRAWWEANQNKEW